MAGDESRCDIILIVPLDIAHILGPDGPIARRMGAEFEDRPQQVRMAEAVERAFAKGEALLVEAGTGVGKSFAYLLPAIKHVLAGAEAIEGERPGNRRRVVISTHTIALQEQIFSRDLPLLRAVLGVEFTAVLAKGRGNYLSRRRLQNALERQDQMFADPEEVRSLHAIHDWAAVTEDGSLATLPALDRPGVWDKVQSDAGNCMGRRCPTYDTCFYQQARRRMENAQLLIVNHALFFADLALRAEGGGFLPDYDAVVLDEAHTVEDVASEHFGLRASEYQTNFLLSTLLNPRTHRGFLTSLRKARDASVVDRTRKLVQAALRASTNFFDAVEDFQHRAGRDNGRLDRPGFVDNTLSPVLAELALALKLLRDHVEIDADKYELAGYAGRCEALAGTIEALVQQQEPDCVYWLELSPQAQKKTTADASPASDAVSLLPVMRRRKTPRRLAIQCAPIDVGPLLAERLFAAKTREGRPIGVVMTSATLATPGSSSRGCTPAAKDHGGFAHIQRRLGCAQAATLQLGSPFDYARQAELRIEPDLPEPNSRDFFARLMPRVLAHLERTRGGAFVLFTGYELLRKAADWLREPLSQRGLPLLVQGEGQQRTALLERFRNDGSAVLLGTASFWQGVDVRGDALRNVIITRLPFDVPDEPLVEARTQRITARGGNAFSEYSLPEAILKFKQGFGRLIRSKSDRGCIVVLDSRIATKSYGRLFLAALPPLPVLYGEDADSSAEMAIED